MKTPSSFIITTILPFCTSMIFAQDLQLTQGDMVKTISAGSYIQVELPTSNDTNCKRCPVNMITGKLISTHDHEIEIRLLESKENIVASTGNVGYNFKKYTREEEGPIIKIEKSDILSLVYKGRNKLHTMHPGDQVGDAMIRLGIVAILFTSFGDERPDYISTGSALAVFSGAILELIFYQPFYKTSQRSALRKGIHKVWTVRSGL